MPQLCGLPQLLLDWYDTNARILPWRDNTSPYRVWVSEIMLQQTRVETVIPYFERFVGELPDIFALAGTPDERLYKLWEGLGYYSRARNMKKAAETVVREYGGRFPASFAALRELSGMGDYTAGAVASIAFGIRVPAVDGNVLRVLSRLTAYDGDVTQSRAKRELTELTASVLPESRVGDFNQALMELGALVCLPKARPHCEVCPAARLCEGLRTGRAQALPVRTPRPSRRVQTVSVLLLESERGLVVQKRPDEGLLAGLWEFPNVPGEITREQVMAHAASLGLCPLGAVRQEDARHEFTHVKWQMQVWRVSCALCAPSGGWRWADKHELENELAMPSAFLTVVRRGEV